MGEKTANGMPGDLLQRHRVKKRTLQAGTYSEGLAEQGEWKTTKCYTQNAGYDRKSNQLDSNKRKLVAQYKNLNEVFFSQNKWCEC